MKNADMPAMPVMDSNGQPMTAKHCLLDGVAATGMTKREMMAMHLHAALLTANDNGSWAGIDCDAANHAVREADCLLAELERTCQKQ